MIRERKNLLTENLWSTIAAVTLGSYIGVLIRIGLSELAPLVNPIEIFPSFYAEFIGCIFMGVAVVLEAKIKARFFPLFPFLTSGVAGSMTTFSVWMQQASLDLTGLGRFPVESGRGVLACLTLITLGVGLSSLGYSLGRHLGILILYWLPKVGSLLLSGF